MSNEKFTQLPTVTNSNLADIIATVQSGTSSQETLGQVFTLFLANMVLNNAGNPNSAVAGLVYQLCWDTTNHILYVCTMSGNAATAVWMAASDITFPVSLAQGGTGAALTASAGAVVYSGASAMAFSAVGSSGQLFQSTGTTAPGWTTPTYPSASGTAGKMLRADGTNNIYSTSTFADTYAVNTILYASGSNTVTGLSTGNNGVLITGAGGIPSISSTLPATVQGNITQLGAQSQALNMNSHLINNVTDPVNPQDACTKNYADNIIGGGGQPVYAATTGALTVTQSGAGVGATLTNADTQIIFVLDGTTPPLNSRILVKDQASNTQDGVYILTNVGSVITNWILTRAADYDTPQNINDTGAIPVDNGTINAKTGWFNTTTMVTVDTTPVTFIRLGTSGTVTTVSVATANNFSGTVANPTTTPAITIGANTSQFSAAPSTVSNVTGDGTIYTIILNNADYNPGSILNTGSGVWTLIATGMYTVSGAIALSGIGAGHTSCVITVTGTSSAHVSGKLIDLNTAAISDSGVVIIPISYNYIGISGDTSSITIIISGSTKTVNVTNLTNIGVSLLR